jgi:4-hydroxybenzoate polyprenyltransferase
MPNIKSILLLSRPINLIIIGFTMCIVRWFVLLNVLKAKDIHSLPLNDLQFCVLVLASVLIAAAGNIINDYFDQRADKINKPQKVIIGKSVNRKVAILIHQSMNAAALGLVLWVSIKIGFLMLMILPLLIALLLWSYSPLFKKKPLVGNLLVAFCTAAVPIFAVLTDLHLLKRSPIGERLPGEFINQSIWPLILAIAAFAFVLTMIREAVKDVQDEPGDRSEHYQTLPIIWGLKRTKRYVMSWMLVFLCMVVVLIVQSTVIIDQWMILGLLVLPMLIAFYFVVKAKSTMDFGKVSLLIKIVMMCGLILLMTLSA